METGGGRMRNLHRFTNPAQTENVNWAPWSEVNGAGTPKHEIQVEIKVCAQDSAELGFYKLKPGSVRPERLLKLGSSKYARLCTRFWLDETKKFKAIRNLFRTWQILSAIGSSFYLINILRHKIWNSCSLKLIYILSMLLFK